MKIELVLQKDESGCGPACLAMVLGISYQSARSRWPRSFTSKRGLGVYSLDRRLAESRYAVARIFRKLGHPWPPVPFASVHICCVDVVKRKSTETHHYVVMDSTGQVFDPGCEGAWALKNYEWVYHVAGLFLINPITVEYLP